MKLSYSAVLESSAKMHRLANELKMILDDISTDMKTLTNSDTWAGLGSEYVATNYEKLKVNFEPIYQELERSILFMADVSDGYKYLDNKIKEEIINNLDLIEPEYIDSRIFVTKRVDKKENNA